MILYDIFGIFNTIYMANNNIIKISKITKKLIKFINSKIPDNCKFKYKKKKYIN